jgi:hypothetical protein
MDSDYPFGIFKLFFRPSLYNELFGQNVCYSDFLSGQFLSLSLQCSIVNVEGKSINLTGCLLTSEMYWLWKESLNSDGQQFHQYQQNEQPHFT